MREKFVAGCVAMVMPRGRGRPRHNRSSCPETFFVVLANRFQLFFCRFGRLHRSFAPAQFPTCVVDYIIHIDSRMDAIEKRFSVSAEVQNRFGRDHGGWPSARQAYTLAPTRAIPVTRTSHVRHALGQ